MAELSLLKDNRPGPLERVLGNYKSGGAVDGSMARPAVRSRPLALAMRRMRIPLRRIRQGFETRDVREGGLYGKLWWRPLDGARVGGFFGFITDPEGWGDIEPRVPEAVVLAFVRPRGHPLHRRLVARKGSLFEKVARRSRAEEVPFTLRRESAEGLLRHRSMRGRPDEILALSACDFFMTSFRAFWAADFLQTIQKLPRSRRKKR